MKERRTNRTYVRLGYGSLLVKKLTQLYYKKDLTDIYFNGIMEVERLGDFVKKITRLFL